MDEKKENEVICWMFAIGNFKGRRGNRKQRAMEKKIVSILKELDGFVGLHFCPPRGTLLIFDSEYNAISARNYMRYNQVECGVNICEVRVDKKYLIGEQDV